MYLLGYDIGSSSVKASLIDSISGKCLASDFYPKKEMPIKSVKPGWAEQNPEMWWENLKQATKTILEKSAVDKKDIKGIGISYQMHGLVVIDKDLKPLRDAIIWCDSRAVEIGEEAYKELGDKFCLNHLLNSPGNFTASKLEWVKNNEPELYEKIYKFLLPGDYIALKLSGRATTTISGLSEATLWDFKENKISSDLLNIYGINESLIPEIVDTFSVQAKVNQDAAQELGLSEGTPISYRAGDQPNNALSLGVLNPGEVASTAGTSGVVYGIIGKPDYDPKSRVNIFAHVNYTPKDPRLGVLLCINGTGILNSWIRNNIMPVNISYSDMNHIAEESNPGADGITIIPFGNGAERVLENRNIGASIHGINFNNNNRANLVRAAQEGIVFSFMYGMEIMKEMGLNLNVIKAGNANMFLSPIFRETLATISGAVIELYDTDGAAGAARGAGIGVGIYKNANEAFGNLDKIATIKPNDSTKEALTIAYKKWKDILNSSLK